MEKRFEFKATEIVYCCNKCNEIVEYSYIVTIKDKPCFKHTCSCGESYWLDKKYPLLEYK